MSKTIRNSFSVVQIGIIHSKIKSIEQAPLFYTEGAPNALLEIYPVYQEGLFRIKVNDDIIIITWLHLAKRDVFKVHPRGDKSNPLTGVFLTRSPDRPNPLGLHRVKVLKINSDGLQIGPIEVIDGTPVIDIKQVVNEAKDY